MGGYIVRRLLMAVPVLFGTTFIIYVAVYALPGDPVQALAGPNQVVSPSLAQAMRERYHLDEPLLIRYGLYLRGLLGGDLGVSFSGRPVSEIIAASWPVTLQLGLTAWLFTAVIGVPLGTLAGVRRGRAADMLVLAGTTFLMGVPFFVVAYVAQIVLGVNLGWLPVSGTEAGWPLAYVLPGLVLALYGLPQVARLTRTSVLDNLGADHVDTAIAKGLPRRTVVLWHVVRNSLVPVVSLLGVSLGYLLSGTVLIEGIFNLPGLGYQIFVAVPQHDGPVVVGVGTLLVIVFLLVNLMVDLLYGILDPRIRLD
ncbi:ABC-type dipeptide/oligopeptide/nickel transport system permease component [Streptosporangium becharense]|uniref:ABC-type dipeptide/oligopeptide/nickel transport system permease component n=1 Tax=Streptosporangium becharense TaxID=1816182 RepID=A0A7W9ID61_9ACTN|nr:ABC transporter permease [Streptosporangium becharense]MBB2912815.1 ABC-type dipeptide/oligopeptide/nickel transport system permease component [Streptosporangium becharense]MBB5818360.1 ABC-type dipeptide/oligopeptide/nickel transport system permease component [Streptosporangium becharense]